MDIEIAKKNMESLMVRVKQGPVSLCYDECVALLQSWDAVKQSIKDDDGDA